MNWLLMTLVIWHKPNIASEKLLNVYIFSCYYSLVSEITAPKQKCFYSFQERKSRIDSINQSFFVLNNCHQDYKFGQIVDLFSLYF